MFRFVPSWKISWNSSSIREFLVVAKSRIGFLLWSLGRFLQGIDASLKLASTPLLRNWRHRRRFLEIERCPIKFRLLDCTPRELVDPMFLEHWRLSALAWPKDRNPQRVFPSPNSHCWLHHVKNFNSAK